ncbi:thiosulfate oxidation carrier complex protein SoxZ [Xanthobacter dioxanivorans]|uniref:Thiosulfate oxidation carrier complex protein SoxZ n=1 Tax=Xanthobacter dioxanivorans TaxID=2528964 RepID=A0A974PLR9_9HYPH|nr:thiosulfate oxidation carrier complex protein SoxZ [Xanthobacter dioxanivorans]QRG05506.1 thiosulfate oxidation carrier complex protein SoxZ [Xanthobacter dioxanivorans]
MTIRSTPRVRVPTRAKMGEVIEIKTLISHEMDNGQGGEAAGEGMPSDIVNSFEASFNGRPFFSAEWFPSVSANPFQSFFFKVKESGEFTFVWKDDQGAERKTTARLTVA